MNNLIGIVACGGQSSRMKTDKSLLQYHTLPQRYHVYEQLQKVCNQVYLSINKTQEKRVLSNFNYFVDDERYENIGPMSSILTAMNHIPNSSFLLVGCDYPLLEISDIEKLIASRNINYDAVCYMNNQTNFIEPLLAIYESKCLPKLNINFAANEYSLSKFLQQNNTFYVHPNKLENIKSIDTIDEYELLNQKMNHK